MTATVHAPTQAWVRAHIAALTIVLLSIALAVSLSLLVLRLTASTPAAAVPTVSSGDLNPVDNGCQVARPGQPC